jgi:hypothetical protein
MLYELRHHGNLIARGSNSYCRTRLYQLTGWTILGTGWTLEPYFDVKKVA